MTTPIDSRRNPLTRTSSNPVARPEARPELQRSNSAPARLPTQPQPVRDGMETRTAAAPRPAAAPTAGGFFSSFKDAAKNWHKGAVDTATKNAVASGVGKFGMVGGAAGVAGGIFGIQTGVKNIIEGVKNGDGHQVAGGVLGAAKGTLGTVKGGLATAAAVESYRTVKGLEKVAAAAIGDGSKLGKALARSAAEAVHLGKDLTKVDVLGQAARSSGFLGKIGTTLKSGAAGLLGKLPGGLGAGLAAKLDANIVKTGALALGGNAKGVATALKTAETATKAAGAAAKGAGSVAKLAGRFAPGLNVGIAALDVGIAVKTITDPKASIAAKVTSGITALGSVAAATNIPIVSQVGAAVSIASTAVGAVIENFDSIKEGAKKFFKGW
jgi:hypothetical protein